MVTEVDGYVELTAIVELMVTVSERIRFGKL